jgi:hypothetical protein
VETVGFVDEYFALCRTDHTDYWNLYLYSDDIGALTDGGPAIVSPLSGSITADAGTSPRWSFQCQVSEDQLPTDTKATLPFTGTVDIVHTLILPSGVPANVFAFSGYVTSVKTERPSGLLTLTGQGFEGRVREDTLTVTHKFSTATTVVDAIEYLIRRTFDVPTNLSISHGAGLDTTTTLGDGYTLSPGDDPLAHILDLSKSIGAETFARPTNLGVGVASWRIQEVAARDDYPNVANVVTPETVMLSSESTVNRAPNRVRLRFEPAKPTTAKPARTGAATVTSGPQDPDTMGRVTEYQRRAGYRTAAQANAAAGRVLTQRSRRTRSVSWRQVPAPWTAPGDTCQVRTVPLEVDPFADTDGLVVNRLEITLASAGPMLVVARATDYTE